jgi:hypothetical protein
MTTEDFKRFEKQGLWINQLDDPPKVKFPIRNLTHINYSRPEAWDGETVAGQPVYIRYRYGVLTLNIDDHIVMTWTRPDIETNGMDGYISAPVMRRLTDQYIDWAYSHPYEPSI